MNRCRRILSAILTVAIVGCLAGCGSSGSSEDSSENSNEEGSEERNEESSEEAEDSSEEEEASTNSGGTLRVMLSTNVISLDTSISSDAESFEVIADCIDGLTQMDAHGNVIPAAAESWDVSEDGLTYTFHLREDAVWSNGEPVTANDFVFAWQRGVVDNDEYGYMFSDAAQIKNAAAIRNGELEASSLGVAALDDYTFEVTLEVPVSYFDALMYFPAFYPIKQDFFESQADGVYGTSPKSFLSNGAFVLDAYIPGTSSISLVKNDLYYDADSVALDGLEYHVVSSSDNALTAFESGTLDIVTISGDQVSAAEEDEDLSDNLEVASAGYLWYLTYNQTENNANGYLGNANMRLAISNAIDRESIVDNYLKDGSVATYTAVPEGFAFNSTTGEDFAGDQEKFSEYCSDSAEQAQAYFEQACEELGQDTFTFTLIYGNNEGDEIPVVAQAIQQMVQDTLPGVTIVLSNMAKAERQEKMQNDNYEIALSRCAPDYADPMTYFAMWVTGNASNYGFWSNEEYDDIIVSCTTGELANDYDARWEALYDAEELVLKEAVICPIYTKSNANLIVDGVEGVEFHSVGIQRVFKRASMQ